MSPVVTSPGSIPGALRQTEPCSAFDATAKRLTQCWSTAGTLWLNEGCMSGLVSDMLTR